MAWLNSRSQAALSTVHRGGGRRVRRCALGTYALLLLLACASPAAAATERAVMTGHTAVDGVDGVGSVEGTNRGGFSAGLSAEVPRDSWRWSNVPYSDGKAARGVHVEIKVRSRNSFYNYYRPSLSELAAFYEARKCDGTLWRDVNPYLGSVTGNFTGTPDELIQWAARKWGIPTDIIRAQAANESSWYQLYGPNRGKADRRDGVDASLYPEVARIDPDSVYEALGIMQIKWRPCAVGNTPHPGTDPLRWKSTAFNLDYYGAWIRAFFDGVVTWPVFCRNGQRIPYFAGSQWDSVGAWYDPTPTSGSCPSVEAYISNVRQRYNERVWEGY